MESITKMSQGKSEINISQLELVEKVVKIRRITKVIKGGRALSFGALVVMGDGAGMVGVGSGKAKEVIKAVEKGGRQARSQLIRVPLLDGTIPHEVSVKYKASHVFLKPAAKGTGVIAGGGVRAVLESTGIQNILAKSKGCNNPYTLVKATIKALEQLRDPLTIARKRGISLNQVFHG